MESKTPSFTLMGQDGKKIRCDLLFTFECDENGKKYMVYTDNSRDEEGNLQLFASTFEEEDGQFRLMPVETEKEWKRLEIILEELRADAARGTP